MARRLVESSRPDELDEVSLPDALRRHLQASLPDEIGGEVEIVGTPAYPPGLSGDGSVSALRRKGSATPAPTHEPNRVDVTLSYLEDVVTLDVHDDGIGLGTGEVHDRGTLTGGQGLATLTRRVESLEWLLDDRIWRRSRLRSHDAAPGAIVSKMIRVVVADDHPIVRQGVVALLETSRTSRSLPTWPTVAPHSRQCWQRTPTSS